MDDPFIIRNLTFGIEDSIISTTGVLVGIASAKFDWKHIVVTGLILIFIEASSMSFGAFLSEENFLKSNHQPYSLQQILLYASIMFGAYFGVGLLLLLPFMLKFQQPIFITLATAILMLFTLVYTFEKNVTKMLLMTLTGATLMGVSIVVGNRLS